MRRPLVILALLVPLAASSAPLVLNQADFQDRVYACFLGKNIGGTLGMPFEGNQATHHLTYFDPVPKEPAANDDLDLQLLWLKALEERGPGVDARALGEYWLSFVPVDWNEYGVGKANMREGFLPPLSGQVRNAKWRDSNGAWIRSEIWACVAPGSPAVAARYAFEDACVDHGVSEGTFAEMFTASLESAAFFEHDRDRLLDIALSYIPADCGVAKAVRAVREAKARGLDQAAAREVVLKVSAPTGWFMAPRNVAFVVLGWLSGDDDFGKSLCAAVNCGDDTDCTGATLGSLLGILMGTKGISDRWRQPIGETILNVAISGFTPPRDLHELTERTMRMAPEVLRANNCRVAISPTEPTSPPPPIIALEDPAAARSLWARSPYQLVYDFVGVRATLDYRAEPFVAPDAPLTVDLLLENQTSQPLEVALTWRVSTGVVPAMPTSTVKLPPFSPGRRTACHQTFTAADNPPGVIRGTVEIAVARPRDALRLRSPAANGRLGAAGATIPFALLGKVSVSKDDLALASRGAKAISDSELEREIGWTPKAIDGIVPDESSFEGQRWHSALTPHPHWIAVELPQSHSISHVIVHFADPLGHPVDFDGQVSDDGQTWRTVFAERGYSDPRRCERRFTPTSARRFRLLILKSASAQYPNAAQIGELEVLEH